MASGRVLTSCTFLILLIAVNRPVLLAYAQETRIDTTRVYELETVVKTAERSATVLSNTTSATSVITSATIRRYPGQSVSDLLAMTPGMSFFSLDGLGYDPQPVVRGFYGGGEAEYVLLQIDGQSMSDMESGLVDWNAIPVGALQSIEILRGGSSALYGDAAVGAVINMISPPIDRSGDVLSIRSGKYVPFDASFRHAGRLGDKPFAIFAGYTTIDGFRDHAERDLGSVGARLRVLRSPAGQLTLNTEHHWNNGDIPGPILREDSYQSKVSLPFFRYDRSDESVHRLGASGTRSLGKSVGLDFSLTGQLRNVDAIETLPLSAGFADTQERDIRDVGVRANGQAAVHSTSGVGRLLAGMELSSRWLDSHYYTLLSGTAEDYSNGPPGPERSSASEGTGARLQLAAYSHYDLRVTDRLRITAGARLDVLRDRFDPGSSESTTVTHTAVSPKLGVNYRLLSGRGAVTNVYGNIARSFKAPTFDQLYDQRAIPVPFPPFQVSLSSSDLKPQYGVSFEAGLYQRIESDRLSIEASAAVYQIDMRDEIDFDIEVLSYRNLGKSRHRGIETDAKVYVGPLVLQGSYTYQATTIRYGDYDGNFVKAIPRDVISLGLGVPIGPVNASGILKSSRRIFLDDANTIPLPDYTTVDVRLNYELGRAGLSVEVFNLLDASFSTTGFPDPGGSEAVFLYPFTGRHLRLGAAVRFP